jgi:hypothetical protein
MIGSATNEMSPIRCRRGLPLQLSSEVGHYRQQISSLKIQNPTLKPRYATEVKQKSNQELLYIWLIMQLLYVTWHLRLHRRWSQGSVIQLGQDNSVNHCDKE